VNDSSTIAIAAFTLIGTICAGFFALVNRQNKTHEKVSSSIENLAKTNKQVVESNDKIAQAVIKQADESEKRNAHLAKIVVKTGEKTVASFQTVKKQVVDDQIVERQEIHHEGNN